MSYTKIYDIEVPVTEDGHLQLDAEILNLILHVNSFGIGLPKKKEETKKEGLTPAKYRKLVNMIFFNCVARGNKPWEEKSNISVSLPGTDVYFDSEKIELSKKFINLVINKLKSTDSIDDLKFFKNGEQWTELKIDVKRLLCLGLATNLISEEILDTPTLKKS